METKVERNNLLPKMEKILDPFILPPEDDKGNIEYKLKLIDKNTDKLISLSCQMRYRMNEGENNNKHKVIYYLGVRDNGEIVGLTDEEYEETYNNLSMVINMNNYKVKKVKEFLYHNYTTRSRMGNSSTERVIYCDVLCPKDEEPNFIPKKYYKISIIKQNNSKYVDIKIAIAGKVDSGKSTLLGGLMSGIKDNGNGLTRSYVLKGDEVKTGITHSIGHFIVGFNDKGEIVNTINKNGEHSFPTKHSDVEMLTWGEIVNKSSKIITFYDLCGHRKYLKSTIFGITSSNPDFTIILIGSNVCNIDDITKEHISICIKLGIPFVIIMTKIDMIKDKKQVFTETYTNIKKIIKQTSKVLYPIKSDDDITKVIQNLYTSNIIPVFFISNVSHEGMDKFRKFLNIIPVNNEKNKIVINGDGSGNNENGNNKVEFLIDTLFTVTGIGKVAGGIHVSGVIKVGDKLLLGPNHLNKFYSVYIKGIHIKRVPVNTSYGDGRYICLAIRNCEFIRKGNVIINFPFVPVRKFKAYISITETKSISIRLGYCPTIYTNNIRQVAKIIHIENRENVCDINKSAKEEKEENKEEEKNIKDNNIISALSPGDKAMVTFAFLYNSEYIKPGYQILMSDGTIKVHGEVREILY